MVLASGIRRARSCPWDLCVCSPPLALGTALPGRSHGEEPEQTQTGGVPDAESMSSWVTVGSCWKIPVVFKEKKTIYLLFF